ncbi:hypothetical protein [uncultured Chryseobacterium sp.]|uniref:hypothetical protein n=1 Tax=uncultured Chryseobacterium sp. TaxID=259322 RepID=UPI0025E66722|nr:hypothetical protein [uncultured Chryseobacterium sp.]
MKFFFADLLIFFKRLYSYFYWNIKGVRITLSCDISIKANIMKGCVFTGPTIISENASVGSFTYGYGVNINNASVEAYCSLGPHTKIGLDEHPVDKISTHPHFYTAIEQDITIIGDHVWCGANVIVLSGVTVEEHSILAAGTVCTKNVVSFSIIGGVPGKIIGKRNIL